MKMCLSDYELSLRKNSVIAAASALCVFEDLKYWDFCRDWLSRLSAETHIGVAEVEEVAERVTSKLRKSRANSEDRSTCSS